MRHLWPEIKWAEKIWKRHHFERVSERASVKATEQVSLTADVTFRLRESRRSPHICCCESGDGGRPRGRPRVRPRRRPPSPPHCVSLRFHFLSLPHTPLTRVDVLVGGEVGLAQKRLVAARARKRLRSLVDRVSVDGEGVRGHQRAIARGAQEGIDTLQ